jgi:hypothetical protein
MALTGMAIAAALGLAKSEFIDKPQAAKQRKLASVKDSLSPWTGQHGDPVKEADPFGTAMQFGAVGAQMGGAKADSDLNSAMADRLNSGGSVVGYGSNMNKLDAAEALPQTYNPSSLETTNVGAGYMHGGTSPWGAQYQTSRPKF